VRGGKALQTRGRTAALLSLLGAALLGGCSNDPHPPALRQTREDGSPWRVRYAGIRDDSRSLDPQFAYDQMSKTVLETICDTPFEYHPMRTDPYELMPGLVERMPDKTANADGTVSYTFHLKRDIRYHDDPCFPGGEGREVTAADMEYTVKRMCDPKVECPVLSTLQEFIAGMKEAHDAAKQNGDVFDYAKPLPGVEVVGSHSFRLHLKKAYPQILYWMAMPFFTPTAREAVEYYDGEEHPDGPGGKMVVRPLFRWHPVTTGPFRLVSYRQGHSFRFIRNDRYKTLAFPTEGWPAEQEALLRPLAGAKLPFVDEVQMPILQEELPIWLLTRQGYLDGFGVGKDAFNSVVTASHELSPKFAERGMRLGKRTEPSTFWIMMNMQDPVLGPNKKLRQALSCSYDAQTWVDIFYNGTAEVARQLVPPGLYGHQKGLKNPYAFDLERAKRLMAEAGYPDGIDPKTGQPLQLTIDATGGDSWHRQTVEFEQRCFERLGVRVRVNENTFPRQQEKLDQGNFQLASSGWGADYPDPENYFFLFYSKNFPQAGSNWSRFANPEFDRMFEQMATMENSPERLALVHQLNAFLTEECPIMFNFHKAYYTLIQPWAPRTNANEMMEQGLKYAITDPVLRDQKRREWNPRPLWPIGVALIGVLALGGYGLRWNRRRAQ
jgi:ABC-type transport system substrate-binding protein